MDILQNYRSIDITDKTKLEEQFNYSRKLYFDAIEAMESINEKISSLKEENVETTNFVYSQGLSPQAANAKLKSDEDYQKRLIEINAYEMGLHILEQKIDFIKSDIRILQNSMYTKF